MTHLEIVGVVVLGILSAVVVAVFSEHVWFQKDAWSFLASRELTSISSLMEPHQDHWVLPTAVMFRALYGLVGVDFWPWYYLPRLLGHVVMVGTLWWVLRRRGADPLLAFGSFVVLLFMGASSWQMPTTVGNFIIFTMLWLSGLLVTTVRHPTLGQRGLLFAMLLLGISANSMGVAGVAGITLATLIFGRVKEWWPSIGAAGLVYVGWYLTYRGFGATGGAEVPPPLEFLEISAGILGDAFTRTLGITESAGIVFVLGFLVFVGWLVRSRRIDVFDTMMLLTLAVYLGLIVTIRFVGGNADPEHVRWGQRLALLILPVVLPRIPVGRAVWARIALAVVLVVALIGNVVQLESGLDGEARRSALRRAFAESAAQHIADGEPYLSLRVLNQRRTGRLLAAQLEQVVADGWNPTRDWGPFAQGEARARLRMAVTRGGRIRDEAPTTREPLFDNDGARCALVPSEGTLRLSVAAAGAIRLDSEPGATFDVRWLDEFGEGRWRRFDTSLPGNRFVVSLVDPVTTATVTIVSRSGEIEVCGLSAG